MISEEERKAIVESGAVFLVDGLRAQFAGWKNEWQCGVHSARPGFWACDWETARAIAQRPDRRFLPSERVWCTNPGGWFGLPMTRDEYQTAEDYERAVERGD